MIYFNEIEPFCIDWLRNQFGEVDERDIREITVPAGALRQHYFAGLGGWEYALRLAGWPEDQEVWTGSCPCQPFSVAGQRQAHEDERDLWPAFFRLIAVAHPAVILGEQVNGAIAYGWLDRICDDLEGIGYAVGAAVLPACGVGAPHIRQRLYWVAYPSAGGTPKHSSAFEPARREPRPCSEVDGVDDAGREPDERFGDGRELRSPPAAQQGEAQQRERDGHASGDASADGRLALTDVQRQREFRFPPAKNGDASLRDDVDGGHPALGMADTAQRGQRIHGSAPRQPGHAQLSIEAGGLADSPDARHSRAGEHRGGPSPLPARPVEHGSDGGMAVSANSDGRAGIGPAQTGTGPNGVGRIGSASGGAVGGMGNARHSARTRPGEHADIFEPGRDIAIGSRPRNAGDDGGLDLAAKSGWTGKNGASEQQRGPWAASAAIFCRDRRWRRVPLEPSFQPLVDGGRFGNPRINPDLSSRIGTLRASGNSIVIPLAAEFVKAVMEIYFGRPAT